MDIENELKSLRYLINDLILYIYDMRIRLDNISPTKSKRKVMEEPNANGNTIKFDLFSIPKERYNELISKYGVDVVNRGCVKLDEFVKVNDYVPFGNTSSALSRRFIKEVLFDIEQKEKESKSIFKEEKVLEDTNV